MDIKTAKEALNKIIIKSRVHLYKPIQIAETLYQHRTTKGVDLADLESYRTKSRKWRDMVCVWLLGRVSTSSARYQDDVFNENAVPPEALVALGKENIKKNGIVEAYIYSCFANKYTQMSSALAYCLNASREDFDLVKFRELFWSEPGLRRSIDKIYEIIVYSLFSVLVDELKITVEVSSDSSRVDLLKEFEDFTERVIGINSKKKSHKLPAKLYRLGVTNAADRGLDIWANFGPAIQVKHLSLDEGLAEEIVGAISADRIVIVCKTSEEKVILSLINQLGWKARIQSIITEDNLIDWYEKALRGKFSVVLGDKLMKILSNEIVNEFPSSDDKDFSEFLRKREYVHLKDDFWNADLLRS